MKYLIALLLLLVVACNPVSEPEAVWQDRVAEVDGEILYTDVFLQRIPADEIIFFGVRLGDPEEQVFAIHGVPDAASEYRFGVIRNLEYGLGQENITAVLYHVEQGIVRAVLVTNDANKFLVGETVQMGGRDRLYGLLGLPSATQDLHFERAFAYSNLGYSVFINAGGIDRVYFSEPVHIEEQEVCAQVITPAVNAEGLCVSFRTPCDVPSGWSVVDSCEGFDAPSIDNQQNGSEQSEIGDVVDQSDSDNERGMNRPPTITI